MRSWIWGLRIAGGAWFFYKLATQSWWLLGPNWLNGPETIINNMLYVAMETLILFGLAEVMSRQMRLEYLISRQKSESRPVSSPAQKPQVRRSIAPVVLNLPDSKPRPPEPEKDDDHEQRIARRKRYRISERRHIGAIAKDMVQDAKENPEGKSGQRFSSKKRL